MIEYTGMNSKFQKQCPLVRVIHIVARQDLSSSKNCNVNERIKMGVQKCVGVHPTVQTL